MSVFTEQESLVGVYHIDDSDSTKKGSYSTVADFTILMNIIRRNEDTIAVLGQELGDYVANVKADYVNADQIVRDDKIVAGSVVYKVINKPRYNRLFNAYKLVLRSV